MLRFFIPLLIFVLLFTACKPRNEKKVEFPDEDYNFERIIPVLVDMHLMEAVIKTHRNLRNKDRKNMLFQRILKKHDYNTLKFDSVMGFYKENIDLLKEVLDSVDKRIQKLDTIDLPLLREVDPDIKTVKGRRIQEL